MSEQDADAVGRDDPDLVKRRLRCWEFERKVPWLELVGEE